MKKLLLCFCICMCVFCVNVLSQTPTVDTVQYNTGKVFWEHADSSNVNGYIIYYGTTSNIYPYTYTINNGTTFEVLVKDLPNIVPSATINYYFAVAAFNSIGEGPRSNEVVGKVLDFTPKPMNIKVDQ